MPTPEVALDEARKVRRLFDPDRLRTARELKGYSQRSLAELAGVSSAAVSQFEAGQATPQSRTLVDLADALEFPVRFFAQGPTDDQIDIPAFFRSLRSTSVRERNKARAFVELVRQFVATLERHVHLPDQQLPRIPVRPDRDRRAAVERAAAAVREAWGISDDEPIDNVVQQLERHGAVVTRAQFQVEKMDAFSVPYEDRPVVVLCADKGLRDRSRFDAAHELGHLVLHEPEDSGSKTAERQADQFAAGFLMPESGIRGELPAKPDWPQLVSLKRRWGTSMASLLYRARTLGVMSEEDYVRATKTMSARGWRKKEPEPLGAPESPLVLRRAVELLADEGLTAEDVAAEAGLPTDQVERILRSAGPTRPQVEV